MNTKTKIKQPGNICICMIFLIWYQVLCLSQMSGQWSFIKYLPFDPDKVYTDVNGKQSLILCQAHLQELIPVQLFYSLVLQILEGVGKVSLVYFLQEVNK